jgi:hypothetical protein
MKLMTIVQDYQHDPDHRSVQEQVPVGVLSRKAMQYSWVWVEVCCSTRSLSIEYDGGVSLRLMKEQVEYRLVLILPGQMKESSRIHQMNS